MFSIPRDSSAQNYLTELASQLAKNAYQRTTNNDAYKTSPICKLPEKVPEIKKCYDQRIDINLLPEFNAEYPNDWFQNLDRMFQKLQITSDETKLSLLISKLDSKRLELVKDKISYRSIKDQQYEDVKNYLIEDITKKGEKQVRNWLDKLNMSNATAPSDLFALINRLAKGILDTDMIRKIWLEKLDDNLKLQLRSIIDKTVIDDQKLTEIADVFHDVSSKYKVQEESDSEDDDMGFGLFD